MSGDLIDAIAGGASWVIGFGLLGLASSMLGLALWLAVRMRARGALPILGRAALGATATLILCVSLMAISVGTESLAGYPLGRSSGAGSLLAYYVAAKVGLVDAALGAGLLHRLHAETGEGLHRVLAALGYAWGVGVWLLGKVTALLVVIVVIGFLLQ
jgi:hypothetical protein